MTVPQTFAEPRRRHLTRATLDGFAADGDDLPRCRVCGGALHPGDYVDPYHPYMHAGNLHAHCAADAPEPREG